MKAPATQFAATRSHSCNERDSAPGAGVRGIEDFQPASPEVERSPSRASELSRWRGGRGCVVV